MHLQLQHASQPRTVARSSLFGEWRTSLVPGQPLVQGFVARSRQDAQCKAQPQCCAPEIRKPVHLSAAFQIIYCARVLRPIIRFSIARANVQYSPTCMSRSSFTPPGAKHGAGPNPLGFFRDAWHGPFITNAIPAALKNTHRKRQNSQSSIRTPCTNA